jgi:thiamine-monophosphate kinase
VISEFELIERFFKRQVRRKDVQRGVGDDAAVLSVPADADIVVTVDTLIEGVHFPPQTDAESIGHKALAVNLSDLSAMGAEPAWITLSLTLPSVNEVWLAGFCRGLFGLTRAFNVELVGGDMTRGQLSITVQAMGFSPRSKTIGRDGARPGDALFVTGCVGDAGLALAAIKGAVILDPSALGYCLSRLNRPTPRVQAGMALTGLASAAIDISDGLAADLRHILAASNTGATIELEALPLSDAMRKTYESGPMDWRIPLSSGDDYELLFTVPENRSLELLMAFEELDCSITRIGTIESEGGLRVTQAGKPMPDRRFSGYKHFSH